MQFINASVYVNMIGRKSWKKFKLVFINLKSENESVFQLWSKHGHLLFFNKSMNGQFSAVRALVTQEGGKVTVS